MDSQTDSTNITMETPMARIQTDNEKQLQTILDNNPDIIYLKNDKGAYLIVNDAFAQICNRPKDSILGKLDTDLWPPDLAKKYMDADQDVIRSGKPKRLEEMVVDGHGNQRFMETIKTPVFDERGHIIGTTGIARDISYRKQVEVEIQELNKELERRVARRTSELLEANKALTHEIAERKETEEKLNKSRAELQTVFNGISEPVVLLDDKLQIKILNQAATSYYQMDANASYDGRACFDILKNRTHPCNNCQVPRVLEDGMPRTFEREGFMNPDRIEKVSVYPLTESSDGSGCIIHIRDLTDEKRMEEELIQADKMVSLGVLVSGVAHEINNPNNLIMLNTPILKEAWQSVLPILDAYYEEHGDYTVSGLTYTEMRDATVKLLDSISGGSKRIKRIVQDLKDFARYQPGDIMDTVDINKSVKNALSLVTNQINKVTHHFSTRYDEALPILKGNRQKLEQVIINLLQNACQSLSDPSKQISVRTFLDPKSDMVAVEVKDEGRGISSSHLHRIMDPFFTTKQDPEGTGLGLSVSNKIIKEHGGRIHVKTEEGKGSIFTILLPTEFTREKVKVLVADDDETIRKLVTAMLQQHSDYLVTTASNGAEACLLLGSDAPDILILDIKMPDMDGIEVCRQIRKTDSLSKVQVIIITGHHESYEAKVLAGMGFTNIVPKPFSPKMLMDMIKEIMETK